MAREPVLMTVKGGAAPPSLEEAAAQLGLDVSALSADFGVVPIDPGTGLYAVEADAAALPSGAAARRPFAGPWSNPRIAPFGPPQDEDDG